MKKQAATKMAKGSKVKKSAAMATPKAPKGKALKGKAKKHDGSVDELAALKARVAVLEAAVKAGGASVTTGGEDVVDVLTGEHLGRTGGSVPLEQAVAAEKNVPPLIGDKVKP